jgi:hypothetical protein
MSTATAPRSRAPGALRRSPLPRSLLAALLAGGAAVGCAHDWDAFDPRLGDGGGGGAIGGSGGTTSAGGTTTSAGGATTSTGGATTSTGGATTSTGAAGDPSGGTGGAATGGTSSGGAATGGASAGGGGTGGEGGSPTRCGGTSAISEDFSGGDLRLWDGDAYGGADIDQIGGELVFTLPVDSPGSSEAYLITEHYFDFRQDAVSVEVTSATNTASSAWAFLVVGPSDADNVEIFQENGTLHFEKEVGELDTSLKTMPYDPVAHRHWRIREDGFAVNFETSPDGVAWVVQTQAPVADLFPMDYVRVVLGGGASAGQGSPGEARFDHLNGGGVPAEKLCPIGSITDDFEDGLESPAWARSWEDAPGMLSESGGELMVTFVPDSTAFAGLQSARAFDLTGSSIVIEVPVTPDPAAATVIFLELNGPGDNDVEMALDNGQLELGVEASDVYQEYGTVLHSPVLHRWWRIRESGNTLFWETAPDGKTWTTQLELSPVPIPIDVLDVEIGGGPYQPQASPGDAHFDDVNLPPP